MSERVSGVVRWFNRPKGYGYIAGDDGREVRVSHSAVREGTVLTEGLRVTYVVAGDDDDPHAEHVQVVY